MATANQTGQPSRFSILFVLAVGGVFALVKCGERVEDQERASPTCVSDYTKCSDNEDVIEHHKVGVWIQPSLACKDIAKRTAKYGEPDLPWQAFGTSFRGRDYVVTGRALLIEPHARYSNAYGAMLHVTARCVVDLKTNDVSVELIED